MKKSLSVILLMLLIFRAGLAQDAAPADTTYWKKGFLGTASFRFIKIHIFTLIFGFIKHRKI